MTDEDPYVDSEGVLLNKLGLTSAAALDRAEADLSFAALLRLAVRLMPGAYDLAHLQDFHREIFGRVYPWAAELRRVDIARSSQDVFGRWQFINYAVKHPAGALRRIGRDAA